MKSERRHYSGQSLLNPPKICATTGGDLYQDVAAVLQKISWVSDPQPGMQVDIGPHNSKLSYDAPSLKCAPHINLSALEARYKCTSRPRGGNCEGVSVKVVPLIPGVGVSLFPVPEPSKHLLMGNQSFPPVDWKINGNRLRDKRQEKLI